MSSDIERIISLFQQEFIFYGLEPVQIAQLVNQGTQIVLERNTVVYSQGAPGDCFYLILQGKVRATRWRNNREEFVGALGPGGYFGEQAFWPNRRRPLTITTIGRVTLLRLDQDQIQNVVGIASKVQANLKMLSDSRSLAQEKHFDFLTKMSRSNSSARKHDFLLYLNLLFR